MDHWLKISEWKYRHASGDLAIEHDSGGWVITSQKAQRMWPVMFSNAEEAMEFAEGKFIREYTRFEERASA